MDPEYSKQAAAQAYTTAKKPETRAEALIGRIEVLGKQLREVRGMTFAATERLLGAEPTPVSDKATGIAVGPQMATPFMALAENSVGELERVVQEVRDELSRINRAFG